MTDWLAVLGVDMTPRGFRLVTLHAGTTLEDARLGAGVFACWCPEPHRVALGSALDESRAIGKRLKAAQIVDVLAVLGRPTYGAADKAGLVCRLTSALIDVWFPLREVTR